MSMVDESSNSDTSNGSAFGCLIFIRKKDGFSVPYDLVPGQITIGSADDADVRIKIPDERLQDIHCLIEIDENGIATLVNKAGNDTVRVNNQPVKKFKILQHNDMIDVIGKQFQYANETLLNNEVQTEKPVPASLSSRNRETINIFTQKRSPSKSPTFKVKSPSERRRSVRRSSKKISDLINLDTPERSSLGKKSHNRSSIHVTPKQVVYAPIVEDVSPATPPNSKDTDDVFKTPVNTPGLFEDLRKSVLQSRTRKSNKKMESADDEKEQVINNKRGRESSVGSQRSVKRRRMMYSTDNNSEVEVLEESFESFDSEDWSEISQDQTDRDHRFSDLTQTPFAYPFSKCMSEPRLRQMESVRLSRHNKTISVNFDDGSEPPVNSSLLLANGIREDHLVESPRPSTSNFVMASGTGSPLNHTLLNKSPLMRFPPSPKLKRLQESPKSDLAKIIGSPKLRSDSYISNNLSKFVGLKQLMRNRNDLSEVFKVKNITSTPKICKSPKNDLTDVRGVKKVMSRNSPKNTLLDISGVDVLFNSPILHESQANHSVQVFQAEQSMTSSSRLTRSLKSMIKCDEDLPSPKKSNSTLKSPRTSVSTTKTPTDMRKSRSTSKMSQTIKNEVLDLSAVKTPSCEVWQASASKRSTKTPVTLYTPTGEGAVKSRSGSAVNAYLDTSKTKRMSRTPKKFDPSEYDFMNFSKKSQVDESINRVVETGAQKRLTRSSQCNLVDAIGSKKSIPSPRPKKSLQNNILEMNRSTIDHDYAKGFNESSTSQLDNSADVQHFRTTGTRRSTRTPISKQRSDDDVYGSAAKNSLSTSRTLNSSEIVDLDNGGSTVSVDQYPDDDVQYVSESRKSISGSGDLNLSEIEISDTSRLSSTRTWSAHEYADDDGDDVMYVSRSRKSRSLSQKYNSPTVIDLETSRRSMMTLGADQYLDDHTAEMDLSKRSNSRKSLRTPSKNQKHDDDIVEIDVLQTSDPRKSLRRRSTTQFANNETVEIDALKTSASRKSHKTPGNNQYPHDHDDAHMSSSRKSISVADVSERSGSRGSVRTPNGISYLDDDLMHTSDRRTRLIENCNAGYKKSWSNSQMLNSSGLDVSVASMSRRDTRTPGGTEDPEDGLMNENDSRTSMSTYRRLTKTPGSSRKSITTSQIFLGEYDVGETSAFRRLTREPGENQYPEAEIVNISGSKKSISNSQVFDVHLSDSLNSASSTRLSRSKSRGLSKTPMASFSSWFNASDVNMLETTSSRRATRTPGGNAYSDEKNISGSRRSRSSSKLLDSSSLHTFHNSTPKSVTKVSSETLRPEDHIINVSGSRVSTRLTKTPSTEKSRSTSQIINSRKSEKVESSLSKRPKRASSVNQYLCDDSREYIDLRKSNSAPKLLNSSALSLESSMSKRSLPPSGVNEHLDDDEAMNVTGSRNSITSSVRLTKTPGISKKSMSVSRIDSPARASVVDTNVTLEIGAPENSEPERMTRTSQSVECNDVLNVSSRSRRHTRTASGSLYLEDEVMSVSMTRKSSEITATSNGNECIMTASPKNRESFFAFEISKSPENDLSNVSGVKRLLKTPRVMKSPKNDLTHIVGVKKLLATPKVAKSPKNDLSDIRGVKKLLKTPRASKSPKNDLSDIRGVKKLLKTPRAPKSPKNDLSDIRGVKKLLQTPEASKSPKNDLTDIRGVKKLLQTPKVPKSPKNDLTDVRGVKKLLETPKSPKSPKNDLTKVTGLKKLMATPKVQKSPKNDLTNVVGIKKLMSTPKHTKSPKNDLSDIVPLKRLMSTPKPTKEPANDLSNVSGVKDLFTDNQEDLFATVFNKKPLRTYSGKFSTSITEEQSVAEKDAVDDTHKSDLVEEWVKKQDFLVVNMENLDEVGVQESTKSTADNKTQAKKTERSKTSKLEEVGEKTRRGQKNDTNKKNSVVDLPEKEPGKRTRENMKNDTEEAHIEENIGAIEDKEQDNELVKPASRSRGKKNKIAENEDVAGETPTRTTRGKKKIIAGSNANETNTVESKSTRSIKSRSEKINDAEGTNMKTSVINGIPTRKARGKKGLAVESTKDVEEKQETKTKVTIDEKSTRQGRGKKNTAVELARDVEGKQSKTALRINEADIGESNKMEEISTDSIRHVEFVQTTEVNPGAKESVQPRRGRNKIVENIQEQTEVTKGLIVQRRGRNKATVEAVQDVEEVNASPVPTRKGRKKKASEANEEDSKEIKESPALTRRGRNKKATEADDDDSKEVKELLAPTRRGQIKKTVEVETDDSKVKESPAPARKGRNKKLAKTDKDDVEDVKEAPAPVRRGRNKKVSEADGDDLKEINELPASTRKGRNKKTTEDEEGELHQIKESPAPTKGGRNKKATKADGEDLTEVKELPAPTRRGRNKKTSVADEDDSTEVRELPAPTRRGRNKRAAEADEDGSFKDVKESLKRGKNKKVVEDVKEDEVKDSSAPGRSRRKAVEPVADKEPKRPRRAIGDYDKYGGAFLSESPLNTKRVRGKK